MISSRLCFALNHFVRDSSFIKFISSSIPKEQSAGFIRSRLLKELSRRALSVMSLSIMLGYSTVVSAAETLTLTTWNIEHLAEHNNTGCKPRTDADYAKLRKFAVGLQADVVALQEVESVAAVHRVFPRNQWNVVISARPSSPSYVCRGSERQSTQQKVAVAIRKGVKYKHNRGNQLSALSVGNRGLRHGVVVDLLDTKPATRVLAVHLKSGCFTNNYQEPNPNKAYQVKSCATLEKQVPVLREWIKKQWRNPKRALVMLGDFNHQLANKNNTLWTELLELQRDNRGLVNAMAKTRACHPKYPKPIDHILMGPTAYEDYVDGSITVHYFGSPSTMEADSMLSDHCPISVKLRQ